MKAAIDSFPLTECVFDAFDYSGLQLHLLTHTPLSFFLKDHAKISDDGKLATVKIPEGIFWSDGSRVTADDYVRGINSVLSKNIFITKFYFRYVTSIKAEGDKIVITLSSPHFLFLEILGIPNFCPLKWDVTDSKSLSSGRYVRQSMERQSWHFIKNPYSDFSVAALEVCVVHSPMQNIQWYETGDIAVTADTAFPLDRYQTYKNRPDFQCRPSGLYCGLSFNGSLLEGDEAFAIRSRICQAVANMNWDDDIARIFSVTNCFYDRPTPQRETGWQRQPLPLSLPLHQPLVLAYDDFYPNELICRRIREELLGMGIDIKLQVDDYYLPSDHFDIRFSIFRGLGDSAYLRYSSFLLNPVLVKSPAIQKQYALQLISLERCCTVENRNAILLCLQEILDAAAAVAPLFEIPSLYLTTLPNGENPFLTHLVDL